MQTQRWVNLGLLFGSLSLFLFLAKLSAALWDLGRLPIPEALPVEPAYLIAFVLAGGAGLFVRRAERTNGFLNEVASELSKVTWPVRKETMASAGVVIFLVAVASVILFLVDTLWGTLIRGALAL